MSLHAELLQAINKVSDRQTAIEKAVATLSQPIGGGGYSPEVVQKILGSRSQGAVGFDGSDTLGLLKISGGARQKSVGWGSYLRANYVASGGDKGVANWREGGAHEYLEKTLNCRPIVKTALAEGSGVTGGYTVPVQFYGELLRLVAEASFVRKLCTTIPMQSQSILIPALTQSGTPPTGSSAFFGGIAASWQPEAATLNESEPSFRQIQLVARALQFYTVASNQLLQDNAVALDTLLTTLFTEAMAWIIDYYILRGTGANQPLGCLNAPAAYSQVRHNSTAFDLLDASKMLSHLLMSSWDAAIWVMHPSVIPQLATMADSANGRLVFLNQFPGSGSAGGGATKKLPMELFGIPIYFTEKVPALGTSGDVMLLDLSKYIVGDRMALQVEVSPHVKFLTNQMVWRIIARWDGQPWLDAPIKLNDGTHQMSSIVYLNSATS